VSNEARNKFLVKRDIFSPFFGREFLNNQNIDPAWVLSGLGTYVFLLIVVKKLENEISDFNSIDPNYSTLCRKILS
jgi:hypothetical protein